MMVTKCSMASGNYRVATNKIPLPASAPDDYSSGAFCLKLSPEWFWIVQGAMEQFWIRALWRYSTNEEWFQTQQYLLRLARLPRTCEECEECEECPPLVSPQIMGNGGGGEVGRLGLTLEELEEYVMGCLDISDSIRYDAVTQKLQVWNCKQGWIDIPGLTVPLLTAASKPEGGTLAEWAAQGKPGLSAGQAPVPSQLPGYTTSDSQACAKATAIVEVTKELLNDVAEGLTISGASITLLFQSLASSASFLGLAPAAATLEFATAIVGAIAGSTAVLRTLEINTALNDPSWDEVVCRAVPLMDAIVTIPIWPFQGNIVTDEDLQDVVDMAFEEITMTDFVLSIMTRYPSSSYKQRVREKLPEQPCGCEQYLPYGYAASSSPGFSIDFNRFARAYGATIATDYTPSPNNDFEATLLPPHGVRIGQDYKSVYTGVSNNYHYTAIGIVFKPDEPIDLSNIKVNWTNTVNVELKWRAFAWNGLWVPVQGGTTQSNVAPGTRETVLMPATSVLGVTYIHIAAWIQGLPQNSGNVPYVTVNNVKFSGVIVSNSTGFVDLEDNQAII